MAYVSIAEAVVKRSFYNDKGLEVAEQFKTREGKDAEKKYTLFFEEPHSYKPGQKLKVGGVLSVKARIWPRDEEDDVAVADIIINNPKVEVLGEEGSSGGFAEATDGDQPW